MARPKKQQHDPEQLALIEVDHPHVKEFKEARGQYFSLHVKAAKLRESIKAARETVLTIVRDKLKVKPNANGVVQFQLDGEIIKIAQGESKLTFSTAPVQEPDDEDEEEKDEK